MRSSIRPPIQRYGKPPEKRVVAYKAGQFDYELFPEDRFQLEETVGEGAFGQVYKAFDNHLQKVSPMLC